MTPRIRLSKGQYLFFSSALKTFAEGITLGSSGAFFLPETFQLPGPIPITRYLLLLLSGLFILIAGAILQKRGEP